MDGFCDNARRALAASGLKPARTGEADVVLLDTAAWSAFETEALQLLDAEECRRAARFRFGRDRSSYVLAHALWRMVLSVSLGGDPREVPLGFLPSGEPRLAGTSLATSVSRSGPLVLIAVGVACVLGVDLERWPPHHPLGDLLSTICAPDEADALRALPPALRERALLQLWTRKESLLKAFGTGLSQAPSAFCVIPGEPVVPPSHLGKPPCRVVDLALPSDRVGALAMPREVERHRLYLPGIDVDRPVRSFPPERRTTS